MKTARLVILLRIVVTATDSGLCISRVCEGPEQVLCFTIGKASMRESRELSQAHKLKVESLAMEVDIKGKFFTVAGLKGEIHWDTGSIPESHLRSKSLSTRS